eukprot:PhF_6_TR26565/c1_g1_i2/m.38438
MNDDSAESDIVQVWKKCRFPGLPFSLLGFFTPPTVVYTVAYVTFERTSYPGAFYATSGIVILVSMLCVSIHLRNVFCARRGIETGLTTLDLEKHEWVKTADPASAKFCNLYGGYFRSLRSDRIYYLWI